MGLTAYLSIELPCSFLTGSLLSLSAYTWTTSKTLSPSTRTCLRESPTRHSSLHVPALSGFYSRYSVMHASKGSGCIKIHPFNQHNQVIPQGHHKQIHSGLSDATGHCKVDWCIHFHKPGRGTGRGSLLLDRWGVVRRWPAWIYISTMETEQGDRTPPLIGRDCASTLHPITGL